jgi:hypothetical protein
MKRGLCQHRLAGQGGPVDLLPDFSSPVVMVVALSRQADKQAGIGYGVHRRENPLRVETSGGPPLMIPTYFRHA